MNQLLNKRTVVQFPGQGAQKVGMGRNFYEEEPLARQTFERADEALGYEISHICFEGPEEKLRETRHSQPAIFITSLALYRVLQEKRNQPIEPVASAGLSLGEYTALVAAGAIRFEEALQLVHTRATAMQEACEENPGSMLSILGLPLDQVESICNDVAEDDVLGVANVNAAKQIVISGDIEALNRARERAEEKGAKRVISLEVAGAFHSDLMKPAAETLKEAVEKVDLRLPELPVVSNVTGLVAEKPDEIRRLLVEQLTSPVLWEPSLKTMKNELNANTYLEVGPGRVLSGLARRAHPEAETFNLQTPDDLDELLD